MFDDKDNDKPKPTRRPNRFTPAKRKRLLRLLAQGHRRGQALKALKLGRDQLYRHIKRHPEFRDLVELAELEACDLVEDALWAKCVEERHFGSIVFWLLNRSQGRWVDKRNLEVNHRTEVPYSPQTQQQILRDPQALKEALIDSVPESIDAGAEA